MDDDDDNDDDMWKNHELLMIDNKKQAEINPIDHGNMCWNECEK